MSEAPFRDAMRVHPAPVMHRYPRPPGERFLRSPMFPGTEVESLKGYRELVLCGYGLVIVGAGLYWKFDYLKMMGGDPVLLVLLLLGLVFGIWLMARERRWLYLACGICSMLTPVITLFVFGAIGYVASPGDPWNFAGTLVYVASLAVGVTGTVLGYRATGPTRAPAAA